MFDASCSFAIKIQILLFMVKYVYRERGASERVRTFLPIFATVFSTFLLPRYRKFLEYRIEQPKNCSIHSTDWSKAYRSRPRTRWQSYVQDLSWSCLGRKVRSGETLPHLSKKHGEATIILKNMAHRLKIASKKSICHSWEQSSSKWRDFTSYGKINRCPGLQSNR